MRILAVSLDLDDTLWPIEPAIAGADQALDDWLRTHHPAIAQTWSITAMRALRARIADENPTLAHDYAAQRLLTLRHALRSGGVDSEQVALDALEIYFAARNRVALYADVLPALAAIAAHVPVISISNGNADLRRIGLDAHFALSLSAREVGVAKPAAAIFHSACAQLHIAPEHVLHVGDDPLHDVAGARNAGLCAAWLNRGATRWSAAHGAEPDLQFANLDALARWLDAHVEGRDATSRPVDAAATAAPHPH